ncbi:MAG: DNA polymerase I [Patescibacteria group bacterium]|nr:DNA polymerase I [Patescibacteria group bacterium]
MASKKQRFIIIDGNALIHRAFHALPPLTTKSGQLVNAVYGFTSILLKVIKDLKPTHLAVTFDVGKKTFRHTEYAEYKATRVKQPQELYDQIPLAKKVAQALNIPIYENEGFEADDLIGTLTERKEINKPDFETIVVTGDLDTLQLIDGNTKVYTLRKGFSDTITYDQRLVKEKYGLEPIQIIDLKGLAGDASDNIPGVKGIGEQTAIKLLQEFESVENIYQALKKDDRRFQKFRPRVAELLKKHEVEAKLSKRLATIVKTVPLEFDLKQCLVKNYDRDTAVALFRELEFKSLLPKLPETETQTSLAFGKSPSIEKQKKHTPGYHLIQSEPELKDFLTQAKSQDGLVIDTETTSLDPFTGEIIGISFSWKAGLAFYLDLNTNADFKAKALSALKSILENPAIKKYGHNLKYDIEVLKKAGLDVEPASFDTMIASYLLNPANRQHNLDTLVFTELGHEMIPIEQLIGKKGKDQITLDRVPVAEVAEYSCEDADYTFRLIKPFSQRLEAAYQTGLLEKIEMPLVKVLVGMEQEGVLIDAKFLAAMSRETTKKIGVLEKNIYRLAGEKFNISSPLQLKKIFFDKLDLDTEGIGVTKTGYSTAASELEKLKDVHPIVPLIIEYRELSKLKSTYLDALPELINPETGRVHTSFNQTITTTGRLSSSSPNLQNIPVRTELGREVRKAFIASAGSLIVSADYSQIELRIAASLANDKNMIESFLHNEDIHSRTAAEINGCDITEVTKAMRRAAKAINFGILYGMGSYGLARGTGLDVSEASDYIEAYFDHHEGIKQYVEQTKALARKIGYVETLFGRRRYLPEIKSGVQQVRASAERMAINMPVQGTAADLMKLAMIEIHQALPKTSPKTKMVLQVHDELVFEVPKAEVKKVAHFIQDKLEGIYKLRVPIKVEVEAGPNWGELEPIK